MAELRLEGQRGGEVVGGLLEHPELGLDGTEVPSTLISPARQPVRPARARLLVK